MQSKSIYSKKAPDPVGPYSPAYQIGDFLFISGQIPLTNSGEMVINDFESETRQVLQNITELLSSANLNWENVVKVGIFTTDLNQFDLINKVYADFVKKPFPARAAVEVRALPKGARIEMEAIAYVK